MSIKRDIEYITDEEKQKLLEIFKDDKDICNCLIEYQDEAYILRNYTCPYCNYPDTLLMYYIDSPDAWAHLAGREGYLTICPSCKEKHWLAIISMN